MSLINDALKKARQAPPRNTPSSLPPLQPAAEEASGLPAWFLPALVVVLVVAAFFFLGWAAASHRLQPVAATPPPPSSVEKPEPPPTVAASVPAVKPQPPPAVVAAVPVAETRPVDPQPPPPPPPRLPKLQGIFYSPTSPSAIIDGKIVRPGDQFQQFIVKAISKDNVTLVGPDKKELLIGMNR